MQAISTLWLQSMKASISNVFMMVGNKSKAEYGKMVRDEASRQR